MLVFLTPVLPSNPKLLCLPQQFTSTAKLDGVVFLMLLFLPTAVYVGLDSVFFTTKWLNEWCATEL